MEHHYQDDDCTIYNGDCLELMPQLAAGSVDSIVTDPPYGLKFMGKGWDHGVPGVPYWQQALRVAKPGAHLLAFGGTRTYHRLAVAIEDAGWEIRDCIMWVYGSGFPKSLDVSKAIDKAAGAEREFRPIGNPIKRMIPGADQNENGSWIKDSGREFQPGESEPATDDARQWEGWGTAIKPSHEPVIWATKPLTVIPLEDMIQAQHLIGELLCLFISNANNVQSLLLSSLHAQQRGFGSAHMIAALSHGTLRQGESALMDMFRSREAGKISLSIVESWRLLSAANLPGGSTFTTSMALGMTTALKTFNLLVSEIIQEYTTPEDRNKVGQLLRATIAERALNDTSTTCKRIGTFAQELATLLAERKSATNAESDSTRMARIASSVLASAITSLEERVDPAYEPILVARKPLIGTVAANVLKHGTGAINVDGCRVGTDDTRQLKRGGKNDFPNEDDSWEPKSVIAGSACGRWPANLIHDGSDEVTGLFPNQTSGGTPAKRSSDKFRNSFGTFKGGEAESGIGSSKGSAARFFYCAKANKKERRNSKHPTIKPLALMQYLVRLVTPPGAVVLDPFMGSGTTLEAAWVEGMQAIGMDLSAGYCDDAAERIRERVKLLGKLR